MRYGYALLAEIPPRASLGLCQLLLLAERAIGASCASLLRGHGLEEAGGALDLHEGVMLWAVVARSAVVRTELVAVLARGTGFDFDLKLFCLLLLGAIVQSIG